MECHVVVILLEKPHEIKAVKSFKNAVASILYGIKSGNSIFFFKKGNKKYM